MQTRVWLSPYLTLKSLQSFIKDAVLWRQNFTILKSLYETSVMQMLFDYLKMSRMVYKGNI